MDECSYCSKPTEALFDCRCCNFDYCKVLCDHRNELEPVYKYVREQGYHRIVWDDEIHAYVSANGLWLRNEKKIDVDLAIRGKLLGIKAKHYERI